MAESKTITACRYDSWSVVTWDRADGGSPSVRPFRCKSWRHAGDCRQECGACDFARIVEAIQAHGAWTYCVLTYPAKEWPDVEKLFRFGVVSWSRLRKRLIREFGSILYIQTWEIHKSEYPHVNVVISNEGIYEASKNEGLRNIGVIDKFQSRWLQEFAEPCGFGWKCSATPLVSVEKVSSYLTKCSLELNGGAVKNQLPLNAPPHFRRLRASRGLLPARYVCQKRTGKMIFEDYDEVEARFSQDGFETRTENVNERKV